MSTQTPKDQYILEPTEAPDELLSELGIENEVFDIDKQLEKKNLGKFVVENATPGTEDMDELSEEIGGEEE